MRVHSITVKDVKGVQERTVTFPDQGVVVVEGPNEVGKSTLLEAFDKLLDPRFKATSTSREIRRLQPVGKDVGPYVEAEFTVGGQRVRYAKRWLRQTMTTLDVLSPAPRQLSGEAAQSYLDRLISSSLDRTLWDALRFTQAQDGTLAPLADSAVLGSALDAAAGSQLHAEEGEQVLDLVAKEYTTYFTLRSGRPTGDYKQAMGAYTLAQEAVSEAHRRLQEAEILLERQVQARAAADGARELLAAAKAEHDAARQAQEAVAEVVAAHEQAKAVLGQASERSRGAARLREERRRLVATVTELTGRITKDAAALQAQEQAATRLIEDLAGAEAAATEADDAADLAEAVHERARADADHLAAVDRLAGLSSLVGSVTDLVGELSAARAQLPEVPVSGKDLQQARDLETTVRHLEAQHAAASAQVRVESLGAEVEVATAEQEATGQVDHVGTAGQGSYPLTEELVVTVPGSVRVVIVPEQGGQARAAELAAARGRLGEALSQGGVESVGELAQVVAAQDGLRASLSSLTHELEVALAGRPHAELDEAIAGHVPASLIAEVDRLTETTASYLAGRDAQAPLPADLAEATAVADEAARSWQEARAERRRAAAACKDLRQQGQSIRARLDHATGRLEADRAQLARISSELEQARARLGDADLDARVHECSQELATAELSVQRARAKVEEADVDGIDRQVVAAAGRADLAQTEHDRATAALHTLSGQIEMAASEGRQEHYDLAVADLEHAERHLAGLDRRARAARHLWRTLVAHREAAHRAYVQPYTEALETLGRTVYGEGFSVTVDDQLTLAARTLDGTTVPFEELSGGAKEQLGILARLAVARLVDPTQGVPVVIDDALGYSDPDRLQQMGQVLGASAQGSDVQVILLTCTPDRYAAIPQASTVRLTA